MARKKTDVTGYDPDEDTQEPQFDFRVEKTGRFYTTADSIVVSVLRNNNAVGLLYLANEEEFAWVKARIEGTYRPIRKKEPLD